MSRVSIIMALLGCCVSCEKPLTNEQTVADAQVCIKGGMRPMVIQDGWTGNVLRVVCIPKEENGK